MLYDATGFALALGPADDPIARPPWMHFGVGLPDRAAVLALRDRLVADGVELVEEFDEPDYVSVKCRDPDGYIVEASWEPVTGELVWPNAESGANSDPWLIANHDRLRLMQPRVLAVNFVHGLSAREARAKLDGLCAALREASRWQGYRDPQAPPFLDYQIVGIADLTEPAGRATATRRTIRAPATASASTTGRCTTCALHDGLKLDQLTERGLVNEVWLLADHTDHSAPWETVEVKQAYDEAFRPLGYERHAGNSGEHSAPWIGRSLRILFVNFARGVGCAMESLGHSLERMATCGALPYYERYFREYAMLDLDRRYGLPFESLYLKGRDPVDYPSPTTLRYGHGGAGAASRTTSRPAATSTSCPTAATTTTSTTRPPCSRRSRPGASRTSGRARGRRTSRALPRARRRLHGPLGRLLAPEHAGPRQHRARRRRPPDEELVAVPLLLDRRDRKPVCPERDIERCARVGLGRESPSCG